MQHAPRLIQSLPSILSAPNDGVLPSLPVTTFPSPVAALRAFEEGRRREEVAHQAEAAIVEAWMSHPRPMFVQIPGRGILATNLAYRALEDPAAHRVIRSTLVLEDGTEAVQGELVPEPSPPQPGGGSDAGSG